MRLRKPPVSGPQDTGVEYGDPDDSRQGEDYNAAEHLAKVDPELGRDMNGIDPLYDTPDGIPPISLDITADGQAAEQSARENVNVEKAFEIFPRNPAQFSTPTRLVPVTETVFQTVALGGVGSAPVQLCGEDPKRSRVILTVISAANNGYCFISDSPNFIPGVNANNGAASSALNSAVLVNDQVYEFRTMKSLFVAPSSNVGASSVTVSTIIERYT